MYLSSQRKKLTVRVIPDIDGIAQEFDYAVPDDWHDSGDSEYLEVGAIVRVKFRNRSVRGWITEINPEPQVKIELLPLRKVSGIGPSEEIVNLAKWASKHWHGPVTKFLRVASPKFMIKTSHAHIENHRGQAGANDTSKHISEGFKALAKEIPPLGDRWPLIQETIRHGNSLILVPSVRQAQNLVGRLKSIGIRSGLHGKDWLLGAQGGTIVGTRSAAFASIKNLSAILMIDEHDDAYKNEATPTWNARDVIFERARVADIPVTFTSPMLTCESRSETQVQELSQPGEHMGWGKIRVFDPNQSNYQSRGLWPSEVIDELKDSERSLVILNRKGRSKLLVCSSCDEIVTCSECMGKMHQPNEDSLSCSEGHQRPVVCSFCLSTNLKNLRVGITRAKEELEALLQEEVQEIHSSGSNINLQRGKYYLGTNAALHRVDWADIIFFADYDQELYTTNYRSEEIALSNLVRAVRIVNARSRPAGQVILQTRSQKNKLIELIREGNFSKWSELNADRRKLLLLPPYGSYAEVSGSGANKYAEGLKFCDGIEVLGPSNGSWLVKAKSHSQLLQSLSSVPRPKEQLRIAVNG